MNSCFWRRKYHCFMLLCLLFLLDIIIILSVIKFDPSISLSLFTQTRIYCYEKRRSELIHATTVVMIHFWFFCFPIRGFARPWIILFPCSYFCEMIQWDQCESCSYHSLIHHHHHHPLIHSHFRYFLSSADFLLWWHIHLFIFILFTFPSYFFLSFSLLSFLFPCSFVYFVDRFLLFLSFLISVSIILSLSFSFPFS